MVHAIRAKNVRLMTTVIPASGARPRLDWSEVGVPVRVQLPDLEHCKAQVKCQSGCPVRTDADL
jgi:hypothetical protein